MSHFAKIENGIVTRVLAIDEVFVLSLPGTWVQTSYNTHGGVHYGLDGLPDGGVPMRKNFAGIGFTYDAVLDAFYSPAPSKLYQLDAATCTWVLKPEYSPLVVVKFVSSVGTLPIGVPGEPLVLDTIQVNDKTLVLFTSLTSSASTGVYQYVLSTGTFDFKNHWDATVQSINDLNTIYKITADAWVQSTVV
jgi:hypothetical protein